MSDPTTPRPAPAFFELRDWREGGERVSTPLGPLFVRRQVEPRLPVLLHTRTSDGRPRDALTALSAAFRSAVRG